MNIAFASRYVDGQRQFTHIQADIPVPASPGDAEPQEATACYRVLQGKLPELMHDASEFPLAAELPIVPALPVGSHLNVPLRLSDGSVYGSFCCISQKPDRSLTERDLETMRAFAALAAGQIERDLQGDEMRRERLERINALLDRDAIGIVYQPITASTAARRSASKASPASPTMICARRTSGSPRRRRLGSGVDWRCSRYGRRSAACLIFRRPLCRGQRLAGNGNDGVLAELVAGAPSERLVIEVTEHAAVTESGGSQRGAGSLRRHANRDRRCRVGYSGLRRILDLKPDILKLDMSLTRDIDSDPARAALARRWSPSPRGSAAGSSPRASRPTPSGGLWPGSASAMAKAGTSVGRCRRSRRSISCSARTLRRSPKAA